MEIYTWPEFSIFFSTKKTLVAACDMVGQMKPEANASSMYSFMACVSGRDRGYALLLGGKVLGSRSMA